MSKQSSILCNACGHGASSHTDANNQYAYDYDSDGESGAEPCNCDFVWRERGRECDEYLDQRQERFEDKLMNCNDSYNDDSSDDDSSDDDSELERKQLNQQLRALFRNITPQQFLNQLKQHIDQCEKETRGDE